MTGKEAIRNEILALRCRRGEPGAYEELVRLWERPLLYSLRRLVDDEGAAWDALQETWLKAFRGIAALRKASSLPVWLYGIARRTAMSHLRDVYARPESPEDPEGLEGFEEPEPDFEPEDAEEVHRGLLRIARPFREVLALYFLEGLSIAEIAEVVGIPSGTVKSRLHHARRALREAMGPRR